MFTGNVYKFAMFTGKHLCWSPFLTKMRAFTRATYQKMTATQVLFCKYCKILSTAYINDLLRCLLFQVEGKIICICLGLSVFISAQV